MITLPELGARALWTRWLVRAPSWLYRARLGFLFGTRLLMLEHIGRNTGARRYVVLEVVDRPGPDEYVIVSGFGRSSQWYRNIVTQPAVRVSCGFRWRLRGRATPMSTEESAVTLQRYARKRPKAWTNLRAIIEAATDRPVEERCCRWSLYASSPRRTPAALSENEPGRRLTP